MYKVYKIQGSHAIGKSGKGKEFNKSFSRPGKGFEINKRSGKSREISENVRGNMNLQHIYASGFFPRVSYRLIEMN